MSFILFCRTGPIPEMGHLANYQLTCKNKGFDSRPACARGAGAGPAHSVLLEPGVGSRLGPVPALAHHRHPKGRPSHRRGHWTGRSKARRSTGLHAQYGPQCNREGRGALDFFKRRLRRKTTGGVPALWRARHRAWGFRGDLTGAKWDHSAVRSHIQKT